MRPDTAATDQRESDDGVEAPEPEPFVAESDAAAGGGGEVAELLPALEPEPVAPRWPPLAGSNCSWPRGDDGGAQPGVTFAAADDGYGGEAQVPDWWRRPGSLRS